MSARYLSIFLFTTVSVCISFAVYAATPLIPTFMTLAANTITIDVNNQSGSVNYAEVDKFIEAQDKKSTKFVVMNGDQLVFSDKPIAVAVAAKAKVLQRIYKPAQLADLGLKLHSGDLSSNEPIIKMANYRLASTEIKQLPRIPEFVITPMAPVTFLAEGGLGSAWSIIINQPKLNMLETDVVATFIWVIASIMVLMSGGLLALSRSRRLEVQGKQVSYSGKLGAPNEMIGKGKLFDFNGNVLSGEVMPINTMYLNILWNVGKFSQDGAVNTYFYMAFYIPPQHNYAATLVKKVEVKEDEVT